MADGSEDLSSSQQQLKIVLVGDGTVGKTSLATQFTQSHFGKAYQQTIGLDFFIKRITLPGDVHVTLQVWDIGGQAIGGKMFNNYVYGAHAVLLVYDVTNYASFENLDDWLSSVAKVFPKEEPLPYLALVGNKCDLEHMRVVRKDRHTSFAKQHKMTSHYVSAKTDDMINHLFLKVSADILKIRLTDTAISEVTSVIKAEISPRETKTRAPVEKRTWSSICTIQ